MPHGGRLRIKSKSHLEMGAKESEKIIIDAALRCVRVPTHSVGKYRKDLRNLPHIGIGR